VDSDPELSELCTRMRESGQSACTIVFCDSDVYVEPSHAFSDASHSAPAAS
jgi:hypothetical protein